MAKLKGKVGASDYYYMTKSAIDAKNCMRADSLAKAYLAAFPDQQQAFGFTVTAAKLCDVDTSKGLAVDPINAYNTFLGKDKEKNKKRFLIIVITCSFSTPNMQRIWIRQ